MGCNIRQLVMMTARAAFRDFSQKRPMWIWWAMVGLLRLMTDNKIKFMWKIFYIFKSWKFVFINKIRKIDGCPHDKQIILRWDFHEACDRIFKSRFPFSWQQCLSVENTFCQTHSRTPLPIFVCKRHEVSDGSKIILKFQQAKCKTHNFWIKNSLFTSCEAKDISVWNVSVVYTSWRWHPYFCNVFMWFHATEAQIVKIHINHSSYDSRRVYHL